MVQTANTVFRDFVTDGIPSSGANNPAKAAIRAWGTRLENLYAAAQAGGGLAFGDLVGLNNDLNHDPNQIAWVMEDSTVANNGIYAKIGASGTGSWARLGDLPYSVVAASNDGSGTANAVEATSSVPISATAYSQLISVNFTAENTGGMTLSINGETPRDLITNAGASVPAGYLTAGMAALLQLDSDGNYRLFSYGDAESVQAAAEAAQAAAEDAQEAAETAQAAAETSEGNAKDWAATAAGLPPVATRTALAALDQTKTKAAMLYETIGRGGLFTPNVSNLAAAVAKDGLQGLLVPFGSDPTGASGAWERILDTTVTPLMWGADPTGVADSTDALQQALATGKQVYTPAGLFKVQDTLPIETNYQRFGGPGRLLPVGDIDAVQIGSESALVEGVEVDITASGGWHTGGNVINVMQAGRLRIRKLLCTGCYNGLNVQKSNFVTLDWFYGNNLAGVHGIRFWGDADHRSDILIIKGGIASFATDNTGRGIDWDGNANSLVVFNFGAVGKGCIHGLHIRNTSGDAAPLIGHFYDLEVDYPYDDGISIDAGSNHEFVGAYAQGSLTGSGLRTEIGLDAYSCRVFGGTLVFNNQYGIEAGTNVMSVGTDLSGNSAGRTWGTVGALAETLGVAGGYPYLTANNVPTLAFGENTYIRFDASASRFDVVIGGNYAGYINVAAGFNNGAP